VEQKNLDFQLSDADSKTASSNSSFDSNGDVTSSQDHHLLPEENEDIILEAIDQNPYDLTYTCLLLPRINSHQLVGDIAVCIQDVTEQLSVSFGWGLDFLQIDPGTDFPQLKEKQEVDFWAPGYLVFLGAQHHPIEIINRYIRQTREQQGVWVDE
jgi:hypothetical protein